ncbi:MULTISPECIES: hypothetical protein [Pseudomonas]|uniref:hypothetical protein n=1 Tax=Pseudomonas TaxID=286 RepID=UPI0030DD734D
MDDSNMLSDKVKNFCRQKGWWYDDASADYEAELVKLGIDIGSDCAEFYLHAEDGPTFSSGGHELYQLGWFSKNTKFDLALKRTHDTLGLSLDYIPLDSFEGESGYYYNSRTGEVLEISLGERLEAFKAGRLRPQWGNFNSFIEFYFELG